MKILVNSHVSNMRQSINHTLSQFSHLEWNRQELQLNERKLVLVTHDLTSEKESLELYLNHLLTDIQKYKCRLSPKDTQSLIDKCMSLEEKYKNLDKTSILRWREQWTKELDKIVSEQEEYKEKMNHVSHLGDDIEHIVNMNNTCIELAKIQFHIPVISVLDACDIDRYKREEMLKVRYSILHTLQE